MRQVNVVGPRLKPGDEAWKAARWNEPVEGGQREEHDAENASDQRQGL